MRRIVVVAACVMAVLVTNRASGQSPAAGAPRFEVASVKPGISPYDMARASGAGGLRVSFPLFGVRVLPGGRLAGNANLQSLILRAYRIREYQLEGGPKWLATDYFDISAKAEHETATEAELNDMLKSLLAERFGLRVHVETRQAPVHTLTVARADGRLGPRLKATSKECEAMLEERKRTGALPPRPSGPAAPTTPTCGLTTMGMTARNSAATVTMGGQAISTLVNTISSELGAPVVDRTGLTGLFDIVLEYESARPAGAPGGGLDPNSTEPLPVPLPAALQDQLGLQLQKGAGPLPITIIDAAEPPSPN